jgi:hypothetical protein
MNPGLARKVTSEWPLPLGAYVLLHGAWLAGYAFFGKGFAYGHLPLFWTLPSLYVGELLLVFAIAALVGSRRVASLCRTPLGALMILFLGWQSLCTIPYLAEYGVDALRDSVVWGYAIFAWVVAALLLRLKGFLATVLNRFIRFGRVFLILGPGVWLISTYLGDSLPRWPGTSVTIPLIKGDEYCVHLAGILALSLQGVGFTGWWSIALVMVDVILAMAVRSGLVAFLVAASVAIFLRPRPQRMVLILASCLLGAALMSAFDVRFDIPIASREVSLDQLVRSLESVVGGTEHLDMEGTRRWRLTWWSTIADYTLFGPYFWTGKGYGVNLADSDGFQVGTREEPLRSPHNSHLTFLARSGVPGFLLWVALQTAWATSMVASYLRALRIGASQWRAVFAWLLAYWTAFIVAAVFDVFLEGPMAGIPFWTVYGLGWGARTLFRAQVLTTAPSRTGLRSGI